MRVFDTALGESIDHPLRGIFIADGFAQAVGFQCRRDLFCGAVGLKGA